MPAHGARKERAVADPFTSEPDTPRPIRLDEYRLAHRLGVLHDIQAQDATCTTCRWPLNGTYHRQVCAKTRKARLAAPAPAQPWEPRPARAA